MRFFLRAFTLIELLVVMAILGLLAAILFPLMLTAKGAAQRAACISNLKALTAGTHLYMLDYDDRLMPVNQDPAGVANSRTDRTWVQNLLPYVTSFSSFRCPADPTNPSLASTFDQDLVPGDTDSQYYTASLHSDYGYNFQNLAPIVLQEGVWTALPKATSQITDEANTLLFADSVWAQLENGEPTGGGNWLITPPCRYYSGPGRVDSFTGAAAGSGDIPIFTTTYGWGTKPISAAKWEDAPYGGGEVSIYGNTWPWHFGHVNVAMVDGSVRGMTPAQLTVGCHVKDAWEGLIFNRISYLWDVQ